MAQHRLQRTGGLHPPEGMQRDDWLDEPCKPRPAAEPFRWGRFGHHYSSLTGYDFLSLSLALGIVKRQSMVARAGDAITAPVLSGRYR